MRRESRGHKNKSSEMHSDVDDEMSDSLKADNKETVDECETGNSLVKKRNSRGRAKRNEECGESKEDTENQEIGKSSTRKRRKDGNYSIVNHSNIQMEESVSKKKMSQTDKENEDDKTEENGKLPKIQKGKAVEENKKNGGDREEYEVEKIVALRTIKGRRQFLVRWKGYTEESDTWEQEKELNCDRLIEEFLSEQEENEVSAEKGGKQDSEIKDKSKKSHKKNSRDKNDSLLDDIRDKNEGDSEEYEVERIVEVHFKKDKMREFLIRWKGFSSKEDTWEPEENLNCPELIDKFIEKLEKIKNQDSRELRTNPVHTNRYTLTMHGNIRQTRRNINKERKTYYECD